MVHPTGQRLSHFHVPRTILKGKIGKKKKGIYIHYMYTLGGFIPPLTTLKLVQKKSAEVVGVGTD